MTHPVVAEVTARITKRSTDQRGAYLDRTSAAAERGPARGRLACAGITPTNMAEYLKTPNVGCVGGSWFNPADAVQGHDWQRISSLATVAAALADPTMRRSSAS